MDETYLIHDNGGRPFKVSITKLGEQYEVRIYKEYGEDKYEEVPILTYTTDIVFVGKSPLNRMTEFSGGYGSEFDGNSILIKSEGLSYISIGRDIFSFTALSKIISYSSPVGNSDVSYSSAWDEMDNMYLLIEDVVIKNSTKKMNMYDNPYDYYYDNNFLTRNGAKEGFKGNLGSPINEFYIGNDKYDLTYHPFPEKDYKRLRSSFKSNLGIPKRLSISDVQGKKTKLNQKRYKELIESFGLLCGFEPIQNKIDLI